MAGSRIQKLGTIFSRVQGLLKAGGMKYEDRPLWYDVYEAFPPLEEPNYFRAVPTTTVRNIFYPEDAVRARFAKEFGQGGVIDLQNPRSVTSCEKFVERYRHLQKASPQMTEDELFRATEEALSFEGISLRRDSVSKLQDVRSSKHMPPSQAPKDENPESTCT